MMSCKVKLEEVAFFSDQHPKNTVKQLISGQGKWTTPANKKLDLLEAEVTIIFLFLHILHLNILVLLL